LTIIIQGKADCKPKKNVIFFGVVIYVQLSGTTSMTTLIFSHLIGQK